MSTKMDPEIKAQWVAALRSGKYKQGEGVLYNTVEDKFCCLGVLCDLAVQAGLPIVTEESDDYESKMYYDGDSETLPCSVRNWAGLEDDDPAVDYYPNDFARAENSPETDTLATINDTGDYTFNQIANIIEEAL